MSKLDITTAIRAKKIFISYSHEDDFHLTELVRYLTLLEQKSLAKVFIDRRITAGQVWSKETEKAIDECDVAILLISNNFLISDFINTKELPRILDVSKNGALVIPVIARRCTLAYSPELKEFQAVNDIEKPLSKMNRDDREEVYVKIVELISKSIRDNDSN
jgi:hypothetical protein